MPSVWPMSAPRADAAVAAESSGLGADPCSGPSSTRIVRARSTRLAPWPGLVVKWAGHGLETAARACVPAAESATPFAG